MQKKLLTAAIASVIAAPMAASALEHSVSGQVTRLIRFADDGKASEIQQLDGSGSSSRIRWRGTGDIGRGMKAGFLVEASNFSSGSSSAAIKANGDPGNDSTFDMRHSRIDFSGKWGRVQLGQTSPAGDGYADQDLTGVVHDGYDIHGDTGGGIRWRTSGGGNAGALTVGATNGTLDGGRKDVLRYDTPALGPVTVAASVANDNYWDVAAYVDTALGGGQFKLSGGYIKAEQRSNYNAWGLSGSYQFSQGTSISGTYSTRDINTNNRDDPTNWHIRVGHKWGNNGVALGFGQGKDQGADGTQHDAFSVAFSHTLPKPGIDLFAGYNYNSLDLSTGAMTNLGITRGTEDVNVFYVGSRIQFN